MNALLERGEVFMRPLCDYSRMGNDPERGVIYKELERLLSERKVRMSAKRATDLTHTMYELEYTLPHSKRIEKTRFKNDAEQQTLYDIIHRRVSQ